MQFEHRGWTIDLSLVGIHHPNYPDKVWEEAKAIWKVALNGSENSGTSNGNREEVLDKWKKFVDWRIDDPNMEELF